MPVGAEKAAAKRVKSFVKTRAAKAKAKAEAEEFEEEMGDQSGGLSANNKGTEHEDEGNASPIPKKDLKLDTVKTSYMTAPKRPQPEVPSIDLEEYSASKTLIPFDQPVPLLRGPIKAGSQEESAGRFILAFKDPISWASAYKACDSQVTQQCESGARIGCSIAASDKCRTPWWKSFTGSASNQEFAERARCEEREMEACLEAAKGKCCEFAKQKCFPAFRDARIAVKGLSPKVNKKELSRLISWVNLGYKCQIADLWRLDRPWPEFKAQLEVSYCRGSDILGSGDTEIDEYLRTNIQK